MSGEPPPLKEPAPSEAPPEPEAAAPASEAPKPAGSATRAAPKTRPRKPVTAPAPVVPEPAFPLRLTAIVALVTIALDQALKWLVVHGLDLITLQERVLIDPFLNLRMAWNEGINFGLFASSAEVMRWVLVAIAVVICLWVGIWVQRTRPGRFARVSAGLLIGGALGNVIDRIAYGAVADFLNMSLPGWRNPYSFNIADIAIFAGAIGLVLHPGGAEKPRDDGTRTR